MDKQKQRTKWVNTASQSGNSTGLYTLVNKPVCNAAMVAIVGISSSTWTDSKKKATEGELHLEREHGNKASIGCFKLVIQQACCVGYAAMPRMLQCLVVLKTEFFYRVRSGPTPMQTLPS